MSFSTSQSNLPTGLKKKLSDILGQSENTDRFIAGLGEVLANASSYQKRKVLGDKDQLKKFNDISKQALKLAELLKDLAIPPNADHDVSELDGTSLFHLGRASDRKTYGQGKHIHHLRNNLVELANASEEEAKLIEDNKDYIKEKIALGLIPKTISTEKSLYFMNALVTHYCLCYGGLPAMAKDPESAFYRVVVEMVSLANLPRFKVQDCFNNAVRILKHTSFRFPQFTSKVPRGIHPNK